MIIDQLPNGAPFSSSDEVAIEKGQTTYKGTLAQLLAALAPIPVASGGTGGTSAAGAAFVRKVTQSSDAYISANYDSDQPITIWMNSADNSKRYGLVVAKTYIGLYDTNNSTWVWRTPLMTQSIAAWQVDQGGTGATTAANARDNLGITTQNVEQLTNSYLNLVAIRNNAGMKFIRCSGYPNQALSANTDYSLGTLSEDYRPAYQISAFIPVTSSGNIATLTIRANGAVVFRPTVAVSTTTGVNIHYAYL